MPITSKVDSGTVAAQRKINPRDYKAMLEKHPRCTDIRKMAYVYYRRTLQRAAEFGTPPVVADAERRLLLLHRAVFGYTDTLNHRLEGVGEPKRNEGPHIHGHQCEPVFVARFPPTDYKALRVDDGKKHKKHKKH